MKNEPAITISIPYYERRTFLRRAVESVLSQTIDDWRLVICDNCSSHEFAAELVAELADDRVGYYRESTRVSRAECFNRGVALAKTNLVALLHDDDALLPNYCELMTSASQQFPEAAGFYCGTRIIGADGKPLLSIRDKLKMLLTSKRTKGVTTLRGEQAVVDLLHANFIYGPSVCFRKSHFAEKMGASAIGARQPACSNNSTQSPFSSRWDQVLDIELNLRLLLEDQTLVGLQDVAYCYCRHAEQATAENLRSMRYFEEEVALFDELVGKAEAHGWTNAANVARRKRITKIQLLYQCAANCLRLRWRSALDNLIFMRRLA